MRRRNLLSASLGLGSLVGLASVGGMPEALAGALHPHRQLLPELASYSGFGLAFGTTVNIKVFHDNALQAQKAIEAAMRQICTVDALMSLYQERSQVFQLNLHGHIDAPDRHLLRVLASARQLSTLTAGAFDVTVQPLWLAFSRARSSGRLPTADELATARSRVNWQQLKVSERQVRLQMDGMAITLNGLAQGYAVDLAVEALRANGIAHALLDTGEFGSIGQKKSGQPWVLGIKHPRQVGAAVTKLALDGRKVATSGDYAAAFSSDYVHHHIFDPESGDSPMTLASVTVLAPTGLMADGLSTAFMVMGATKALALAAHLQNVDVLLVHKNGAIQKSNNFPELSA